MSSNATRRDCRLETSIIFRPRARIPGKPHRAALRSVKFVDLVVLVHQIQYESARFHWSEVRGQFCSFRPPQVTYITQDRKDVRKVPIGTFDRVRGDSSRREFGVLVFS